MTNDLTSEKLIVPNHGDDRDAAEDKLFYLVSAAWASLVCWQIEKGLLGVIK